MSGSSFNYSFPAYSMTVIDLAPAAAVAAVNLFYNHSSFDNNDPAANILDDNAIAPDKQPLLPGQAATFANYSSYSRGINGLMVDVANLTNGPALVASDFTFKVGNGTDPTTWSAASAPTTVLDRPTAGISGSDRVELVWADGAVQHEWLQVTVLADANTGLATPYVFYFGNLVGETGNSTTSAAVGGADVANEKAHNLQSASITSPYDFNRDGAVGGADIATAKLHNLETLAFPFAPPAARLRRSRWPASPPFPRRRRVQPSDPQASRPRQRRQSDRPGIRVLFPAEEICDPRGRTARTRPSASIAKRVDTGTRGPILWSCWHGHGL